MGKPHTDDVAVDAFAMAMKAKLAKKRRQGRSGWEDCSVARLSQMLVEHIDKGDSVDVANFAMMIWANSQGAVMGPRQALKGALRECAAEILARAP